MCVQIWLRVGAQRYQKVANHILGCDNFGEFAVEIDERHRVHPFGGQELPIDGLKVEAPGELRSPLLLDSPAAEPKNKLRSTAINRSALALSEPRRARDREHVRHMAKQPCLVCGHQPADAHHLRFARSRVLGEG